MECPLCHLTSPDSAVNCDCGYNFKTAALDRTQTDLSAGPARPYPRMWVGFTLAILAWLTAVVEISLRPEELDNATPFVGFYMLISLANWIYWLWCVHRFHDIMGSIPGHRHPISPGQAVARHFIPFYNFYWVFKWPTAIATFINWRTQRQSMRGWVIGLAILIAILVTRIVDGSLGQVLLFGTGVYIIRQMRKAFAAPPVPESAMAPPGVPSTLGL